MELRNNFKEDLLQVLKQRMPDRKIEWRKIDMDNGVVEEVININDNEIGISIHIAGGIRKVYTDTFLNEVANYVEREYMKGYQEFADKFISVVKNFETCKQYIVCSLINEAKNKHLKRRCPYKEYIDFLVVCRVIIPMGKEERASILITNNTLKDWGITEDKLFEAAYKNLDNEEIIHFYIDNEHIDVLKEMFGEELLDEDKDEENQDEETGEHPIKQMVVCTDECNAYGANVLLKPDRLVSIANQYEMKQVYIFPCSTKEIILVGINEGTEIGEMDLYAMNCIVYDVNQTSIDDKIFLSNAVYKLDMNKMEIFKVCEIIERQ